MKWEVGNQVKHGLFFSALSTLKHQLEVKNLKISPIWNIRYSKGIKRFVALEYSKYETSLINIKV